MAKEKILAVTRAGVFSPNHIGNDAAIMNLTAEQLRRRGHEVTLINETQFLDMDVEEDVIIDMCRHTESIAKLKHLEEGGKLVINSGYSIENCMRERLTRLLQGNGVAYPDSIIVETNTDARRKLRRLGIERCWVKRAEEHARHKEDVAYCRHVDEAQEILHEFYFRGIKKAVITRHLEGYLIKFYGIADGSFFHYLYPMEADDLQPDNDNASNGEGVSSESSGIVKVDEEALKEACLKAARLTGVKVFGGDCIADAEGNFKIIDFKDWPSFAPCRTKAAQSIAKSVINYIKEFRGFGKGNPSRQRRYMRRAKKAETNE